MKLTDSQKQLLTQINQFLKSDKEVFIIKGYAGSGKTFFSKFLVDSFEKNDIPFLLMAPTGKSAKVLSQKTKKKVSTIHSTIYNLKNIKEDNENYRFYFELNENPLLKGVFIVDEASLISDTYSKNETLRFGSGYLLRDLIEFINFNPMKKLILIGDNAQLPPIKADNSPALDKNYLEKFGLKVEEFTLTEVVRQKNIILDNSLIIRKQLQKNIFNKLNLKYNEEFKKVDNFEYQKNSIIIAYTNKAVFAYNQTIREKMFEDIDEIYPNEKLMVIQNTKIFDIFLSNGDFVKVIKVGNKEIRKVALKNEKVVNLVFRDLLIEANQKQIECKILENTLFSDKPSLSGLEQRALFVDFIQRNNINQSAPNFKEVLLNDKYFNALKVKFGYAITCHKAQGSEWDNIYLDASYKTDKLSQEYFKWLYTAITRAKKRVFIKNPPSVSYLSTNSQTIKSTKDNRFNLKDFRLVLYQKVLTLIKEYEIISITSHPYKEIYKIGINDEVINIVFYYNKKNIITKILFSKENINSNILKNLLTPLIKTPIFAKQKEFNFKEEFLEEFYKSFEFDDIKIINIEHLNYKERYTFQRGDEIAIIDYFYNGKKQFTKTQLIQSNSNQLLKDLYV